MRKILVLEDNESIRGFVVINLQRAGYEVLEAETGEQALEIVEATPDISVALLDLMLPGLTVLRCAAGSAQTIEISAS